MRSQIQHCLLVAISALGLVGSPGQASAQSEDERCREKGDGDGGGQNFKMVRGADGRKVFVIEKAFVVCGKVPKPNVIYVLQATNINYEWENLKQDFLPKIRNTVKKAPF